MWVGVLVSFYQVVTSNLQTTVTAFTRVLDRKQVSNDSENIQTAIHILLRGGWSGCCYFVQVTDALQVLQTLPQWVDCDLDLTAVGPDRVETCLETSQDPRTIKNE
ncbi:hypothetical protein EXN66_Car010768 [Channa argus]|uniref:Uncharacterized protein n=1 Tax=Channa argus TaxID=215402 RepID=A0A6G1PXV0_CHAAH|nr:hypothetical protein EXN66_Car010768 [Channa argus]